MQAFDVHSRSNAGAALRKQTPGGSLEGWGNHCCALKKCKLVFLRKSIFETSQKIFFNKNGQDAFCALPVIQS